MISLCSESNLFFSISISTHNEMQSIQINMFTFPIILLSFLAFTPQNEQQNKSSFPDSIFGLASISPSVTKLKAFTVHTSHM